MAAGAQYASTHCARAAINRTDEAVFRAVAETHTLETHVKPDARGDTPHVRHTYAVPGRRAISRPFPIR